MLRLPTTALKVGRSANCCVGQSKHQITNPKFQRNVDLLGFCFAREKFGICVLEFKMKHKLPHLRMLSACQQNMELRKKLGLEYYNATVSKEEYELYLERNKKQ